MKPTLQSCLKVASYELPLIIFASILPLADKTHVVVITSLTIVTLAVIDTYAFPEDKFHTAIFFFEYYMLGVWMLIERVSHSPIEELCLRLLLGQAIALHMVLLPLWSHTFRRIGSEEGALERWCGVLLSLRDGFHKANTDFCGALGALFMILLDIVHFRLDLPSFPILPPDEVIRPKPRETSRVPDALPTAIEGVINALGALLMLGLDFVFFKWDLSGFNEFCAKHHAPGASDPRHEETHPSKSKAALPVPHIYETANR